jgi:hypothetical protein
MARAGAVRRSTTAPAGGRILGAGRDSAFLAADVSTAIECLDQRCGAVVAFTCMIRALPMAGLIVDS